MIGAGVNNLNPSLASAAPSSLPADNKGNKTGAKIEAVAAKKRQDIIRGVENCPPGSSPRKKMRGEESPPIVRRIEALISITLLTASEQEEEELLVPGTPVSSYDNESRDNESLDDPSQVPGTP